MRVVFVFNKTAWEYFRVGSAKDILPPLRDLLSKGRWKREDDTIFLSMGQLCGKVFFDTVKGANEVAF